MSVQAASQAIVADSADGTARAVNRTLGGIIGYTRWPDQRPQSHRTLCVIGTPRLTSRIAPSIVGGPAVIVRSTTAAGAMSDSDCDILFLGHAPAADRQRLFGWVRGRPVLTISDDDPQCVQGAMFCLAAKSGGLTFGVNLDSIGRGPIRIDPRVLKIGQSDGSAA